MHPILFKIGPFTVFSHEIGLTVYSYGFFIAVGFLLGLLLAVRLAKKEEGIEPARIMDVAFYALIAAVLGARLFYVITEWGRFSPDLWEIFRIWKGGLVFYGGLTGALIAGYISIKRFKLPAKRTLDLVAPCIALGHTVGRWGCFMAGCCYGKPCDLPWAVTFTNEKSLAPHGVHLHPTQIYSSLSVFVMFLILFFIVRPRKRFDGQVFAVYLFLYALIRFILEFFRGDDRGGFLFGVFSPAQFTGIIMALVAVFLYFIWKKDKAPSGT